MKITSFTKILDKIKKKNIAIMGHMGSGKSIFAKKLANHFNIEHIDTDIEIIKHEKASINEIFSHKGEGYFRKIESKIVLNALKKRNIIISLGGGSILSKKIRGEINNYSLSLFLNVDFDILINRLKTSKNRPLLKDVNILTRLKQLDLERRKHFLNADIIIDNSQSSNKTFLKFKNIFSSLDD